jgi:predicted PurR-regulated permease PerM
MSRLFRNIAVFAISFVIMCLTTFYFLKDGKEIVRYIQERIPFIDSQREQIEKRVKDMIVAAIYGGIAVGIAQGTLGGLAFFVLGISSPVLWGSAMAIFSLVPVFGSFTIWGPASAILIISGSYAKGIGLFVFGVLVISSVDNILKPLIIGGRTRLHMLLIFFSVLGGIKFFGFIGFILGPIITVLCISLLEIYSIKQMPSG